MGERPKVSAIVPAYNEENTIGGVLEVLQSSNLVNEIVVVDDGSEDNTPEAARDYNVAVVDFSRNRSKGWAVYAGAQRASGAVFLFVDADLAGLTRDHIRALLAPVVSDQLDMNVGIINRGDLITRWYRRVFAGGISGQRALRRELWNKIPFENLPKRWEPESTLNFTARRYNSRVKAVALEGIYHTSKEEKWGLWEGLYQRLRMIGRIMWMVLRLRLRI